MLQARPILSCIAVVVLFCAIAWVCDIAVFDYDFWWHVKAGQVMRETGWISTDPFAYTRIGLPYLATHEWLSQIILSVVWDMGGAFGIVILRIALLTISFFCLLFIDRRSVVFTTPVAIGVLGIVLSGIVDRPQLFSFAVFCAEVLVLFSALQKKERGASFSWKTGAVFFALQVLWLNLHGAACILGLLLFAAFAVHCFWDDWRSHSFEKKETITIICTSLLLLIGLLLSPSGIGNITYLKDLLTDQTAAFITEWKPREWSPFLADFWWLLILSIGSLINGKTFRVFSGLSIAILFILSRTAVRHEMFLAFILLAVFVVNVRSMNITKVMTQWCSEKRWRWIFPILIAAVLLLWTLGKSAEQVQSHTRRGEGAVEQGKGAFDFITAKNIPNPVFNSYELGGYFLYRGYPTRQVFVDGRNVDYGYDFLKKALSAGDDAAAWNALDQAHHFTAAAILYKPFIALKDYPYIRFLNHNPAWALTYLDDWTAVYVKRTSLPKGTPEYTMLTPELLMNPSAFGGRTPEELEILATELTAVTMQSPDHLQARLQLARLYLLAGYPDDARAHINLAIASHPWRYEPYELLGVLESNLEHWEASSDAFANAVSRIGGLAETIDHKSLADIATKAGKPLRALLERIRAL